MEGYDKILRRHGDELTEREKVGNVKDDIMVYIWLLIRIKEKCCLLRGHS